MLAKNVRMASQEEPEAKKRNTFTKRKTLAKLKECEDHVTKVVEVKVSDLSPFDAFPLGAIYYSSQLPCGL